MSVITVTPTVELSNVPPRVRLNVADTGTPAFTSTTITRLNPDGTTSPVRTTDGGPVPISGGIGLVYDYEAPYGQAVTYSSVETPANVTAPVTLSATRPWLIHPGVPSLSRQIMFGRGSFATRTRPAKKAVYWPMGRSTPVTIGDGARKSVQSQLVLQVTTQGELVGLQSLFADASVLLLNIPAGLGYNFSTCYVDCGDTEEAFASPVLTETYATVSMPFTVVARPAGGTQSQRTLADLLVYPTITALNAQYANLAAVLAGP